MLRNDFVDDPEDLADNMLAVTISCVMLMASNTQNISEEYLTYAERYLMCIKDECDNYPPNVEGILNHIGYVRAMQAMNERESYVIEDKSENFFDLNTEVSKDNFKPPPVEIPIEPQHTIGDSRREVKTKIPAKVSKPKSRIPKHKGSGLCGSL